LNGVRVDRRLAAILAADVAGYSRLLGRDEAGTLARLTALRRKLVDPKIAEHKGRLVKTMGDGLLVEFASAVDAVRCAAEIQRGMLDWDPDASDGERIAFRIGINLGDVIVQDDDLFGDGVNVAARLEALAEPGGICISGVVWDQIEDRLPYLFVDAGHQTLKNIARPLRIYVLNTAAIAVLPPIASAPAMAAATEPPATPRLSIVVLPFTSFSNDREQEYFADAVTGDLTTDLSRISDSFVSDKLVIARNTASAYKGKAVDVRQIGRELGVRYVLEGSVRRLGEQVQINIQLIDAETGAHLWADRFDTDCAALMQAQDEITGSIARTLVLELMEAIGRRIEQEEPPNLNARDFVMRGWAWFFRPATPANVVCAQEAFEQALAMEPGSVDARVGVGTILIENVIKRWSQSPDQDLARAEQLLIDALERNRNHPRALFAMSDSPKPSRAYARGWGDVAR
jgi:adenylate cyclase